jgi:putative tryptophan/tyrosine transport system substrate-binding protein
MLYNPATSPGGRDAIHTRSIVAAAPSFGVSVVASPFHTEDIDMAFAAHGRDRTAVIIIPDTSTTLHSRFIVEAAARHHVPTIYPYRDFVNFGGLLSYGVDRVDLYRRAASYVDRILRGTLPADLAVQNPTKYQLAINLKTAKALGIELPPTLLARADEVIE